jgi:glycosyltransferase involved in cell wall biosynthesis
MAKVPALSVFFPAYNEEANVATTVTKAAAFLPQVADKWEIIVIDDGSKDKTGAIVKSLAKKDPRIRLITHSPNRGYGEALKSGLYGAKYDLIAFTDADGQFDIRELGGLIAKIDGADLVAGYRIVRQDSPIRKLFGWGWTKLANLLLGINVRDVDCGFKLLKKEVIERIPRLESVRGGMISPELLAKTKKAGFKIAEVGVHHFPRREGKSTGSDLKVIFKSFADLGKLWWSLK